jgi:hypothetical protein
MIALYVEKNTEFVLLGEYFNTWDEVFTLFAEASGREVNKVERLNIKCGRTFTIKGDRYKCLCDSNQESEVAA